MRIGSSIFMIAAGLVLALAVDTTVSGVDITTIGWILVAAGVLGLVLTLLLAPRRRAVASQTVVRRDTPVVEERVYRDDV